MSAQQTQSNLPYIPIQTTTSSQSSLPRIPIQTTVESQYPSDRMNLFGQIVKQRNLFGLYGNQE